MLRRLSVAAFAALCFAVLGGAPTQAANPVKGPRALPKQPVAYGTGGGAASMSPQATAAAVNILKAGGNAVDGAVAAASTLGVTEPFVAGPGGGGFFVYYRARDHKVFTIDGREKAPAGARPDMFLTPTGQPMDFETAVESGLSVGVPGMVAQWGRALDRFGTKSMAQVLAPAVKVARRGFRLDDPLVNAIANNESKLSRFSASARIWLPGGKVPRIGHTVRNRDLARTYELIGRHGWRWFYRGPIARDLAAAVRNPPTAPGKPAAQGGSMTAADMRAYTAPFRRPVTWTYRGYRLWGMRPPSSGGSTVGETMNILEHFRMSGDRNVALHEYIEALKLAFADRGKYVGDPDFVKDWSRGLLSKGYAAERAKLIGPAAAKTPVAPGDPSPFQGGGGSASASVTTDQEQHTNHLVVADAKGNVVSYTNTIEQIAGSGITVPGRGFLLNNELTDFNFPTGTANSVAPGKRPRSSMSPTIVTRGGRVIEAVGSPGGSTIITTVLQTLINQIDFGMTLPAAIEAPRASQRNGSATDAEPAFIDKYGAALRDRGQTFNSVPFIGIVAALSFLPGGHLQTATESWRGGGGSAMVVRPENPVPKEAAAARAFRGS